jgi:hypothetical protein
MKRLLMVAIGIFYCLMSVITPPVNALPYESGPCVEIMQGKQYSPTTVNCENCVAKQKETAKITLTRLFKPGEASLHINGSFHTIPEYLHAHHRSNKKMQEC